MSIALIIAAWFIASIGASLLFGRALGRRTSHHTTPCTRNGCCDAGQVGSTGSHIQAYPSSRAPRSSGNAAAISGDLR